MRKVDLVDYDQYNNLLFFLIESSNYIFQLPLVRVNAIPNTLRDRGFCMESDCFAEAEYTEFYLYFSINK
ncbi:MAG: hypothetical protein QXF04_03900 [Candidatus Aenigmatarchaeota archaeon]